MRHWVAITAACLWIACLSLPDPVYAAADPLVEAEIQHLKTFVANSSCVFIRNGDEHPSAQALEHIERKAEHFSADIDSAEKFIALAATRSLMSRREYHLICDGKKITSADWLLQELARYRSDQP